MCVNLGSAVIFYMNMVACPFVCIRALSLKKCHSEDCLSIFVTHFRTLFVSELKRTYVQLLNRNIIFLLITCAW